MSLNQGFSPVTQVNNKQGIVVLTAADVQAVPTSRTVNGKPLTANLTLVKADVGLGNVENLAPSAYPVSVLQQTEINTRELASNKSTDTALGTSNTLFPTQNAVKVYADGLVSNRELSANKSNDSALGTSSTLFPTQVAVKTYVDTALTNSGTAQQPTPSNQGFAI